MPFSEQKKKEGGKRNKEKMKEGKKKKKEKKCVGGGGEEPRPGIEHPLFSLEDLCLNHCSIVVFKKNF